MMRATHVALALLVAGLLPLGVAGAQEGTDQMTVVAHESGCEGDRDFCFEVTEGDPGELSAGDEVEVTLRNPSENPSSHNLYVTTPDQADEEDRDTPEDAAIENTTTVEPGAETTMTFTVPDDADGLYWWCEISGHESLGMWLESAVASGEGGADGQDGADGDTSGNDSPLPAGLALVALAGVALAAGVRRAR